MGSIAVADEGKTADTLWSYEAGLKTLPWGDRIPFTSKWSTSLGAEYDFNVASSKAFIRADYQYQSSFAIGAGNGPGTINYPIDDNSVPRTHYLSARIGLTISHTDLAMFVHNLTNSQDLLNRVGMGPGTFPGRTCYGAIPASCGMPIIGALDTTFRPLTAGLSAQYRYYGEAGFEANFSSARRLLHAKHIPHALAP